MRRAFMVWRTNERIHKSKKGLKNSPFYRYSAPGDPPARPPRHRRRQGEKVEKVAKVAKVESC